MYNLFFVTIFLVNQLFACSELIKGFTSLLEKQSINVSGELKDQYSIFDSKKVVSVIFEYRIREHTRTEIINIIHVPDKEKIKELITQTINFKKAFMIVQNIITKQLYLIIADVVDKNKDSSHAIITQGFLQYVIHSQLTPEQKELYKQGTGIYSFEDLPSNFSRISKGYITPQGTGYIINLDCEIYISFYNNYYQEMRKTTRLTTEAQVVFVFFSNIGIDISLKEEEIQTSYGNWR